MGMNVLAHARPEVPKADWVLILALPVAVGGVRGGDCCCFPCGGAGVSISVLSACETTQGLNSCMRKDKLKVILWAVFFFLVFKVLVKSVQSAPLSWLRPISPGCHMGTHAGCLQEYNPLHKTQGISLKCAVRFSTEKSERENDRPQDCYSERDNCCSSHSAHKVLCYGDTYTLGGQPTLH